MQNAQISRLHGQGCSLQPFCIAFIHEGYAIALRRVFHSRAALPKGFVVKGSTVQDAPLSALDQDEPMRDLY